MQLLTHAAHQGVAGLRAEQVSGTLVEEINEPDDAVGPPGSVRHGLYPGDFGQRPVVRPVRLHVNGFRDVCPRDVLEVFADWIVAFDGIVRTKNAWNGRPLQPGQINLAPNVMVGVDDGIKKPAPPVR